MCQPAFGTNVTTVCRLPHAKAITGQIILYLDNFNKATKCVQNRGPVLGGVMPLRRGAGSTPGGRTGVGLTAFAFFLTDLGPWPVAKGQRI
jgi:hypothetical protein